MTTSLENAEALIDGRNIDAEVGTLSGEASGLEVRSPDVAYPAYPEQAEVPSRAAGEIVTYFGQPMLKEPVWISTVPLYFYVGGLAGASSVLGTACTLVGGRRLHSLARTARWVAAIGDVAGAGLLIADLGRPSRFLNMLRVFRPTSPMSVGSWVLAGSGAANTAAALFAERRGVLGRLGLTAEYAGALFALPLTGYTALLITNTAVPVWKAAYRSMPLLFVASSMASAGAFFELLPLPERARHATRTFGTIGTLTELAAMVAVERDAAQSPEAVKPLRQGVSGTLWNAARLLSAVGLGLSLAPRRARWAHVTSGVLGTLGALALRFAVMQAGKVSARDPRATVDQQRRSAGVSDERNPALASNRART